MIAPSRWLWPTTAVAAALLLASGSVGRGERQTSLSALTTEPDQRPECPHDPREIVTALIKAHEMEKMPNMSAADFSLSKDPQFTDSDDIIDIPEFHDCQRFIRGDAEAGTGEFIDLYAIYATEKYVDRRIRIDATVRARLDAEESFRNRTGVDLARMNTLKRDTVIDLPHASAPDGTYLAATIYSYARPDDGIDGINTDYRPLHIQAGFNCLYLENRGATWGAFIKPNGNSQCSREYDGSGQELEVKPLPAIRDSSGRVMYKASDIPPVARWDRDTVNDEHYIGIRCGDTWCEIGRPGFMPSPPNIPLPTDNLDLQQQRVFRIKGWYDQQYLAEPDPAAPTRLRPSRALGTVVPNPSLDKFDNLDAWADPVVSAYLYASADYPKLALKAVGFGGALNEANIISVRRPPGAVKAANDTTPEDWDGTLKRKVTTDPTKKLKVIRRGPMSYSSWRVMVNVPATARWRWSAKDDKVWTECEDFCCESCVRGTPGCN